MKSEVTMPAQARRRYTEEFKMEALRLVRARPPRGPGGARPGNSRQRVVSLAHPASAGRGPRHDTRGATRRSRGTHAGEAGVGAGDPGAGFFKTCGGVLCEGIPMSYRAIQGHDRRYPVRLMCRALAVAPAGY